MFELTQYQGFQPLGSHLVTSIGSMRRAGAWPGTQVIRPKRHRSTSSSCSAKRTCAVF
jgi:hypothetical protein